MIAHLPLRRKRKTPDALGLNCDPEYVGRRKRLINLRTVSQSSQTFEGLDSGDIPRPTEEGKPDEDQAPLTPLTSAAIAPTSASVNDTEYNADLHSKTKRGLRFVPLAVHVFLDNKPLCPEKTLCASECMTLRKFQATVDRKFADAFSRAELSGTTAFWGLNLVPPGRNTNIYPGVTKSEVYRTWFDAEIKYTPEDGACTILVMLFRAEEDGKEDNKTNDI